MTNQTAPAEDRSNDGLGTALARLMSYAEAYTGRGDDCGRLARMAVESLSAARESERLQAELDALRNDAERYRLLRRGQHWGVIDGIGDTLRGEELDAAIDAKLALHA